MMLETVQFMYAHWVLTTWFLMFLPFLRLFIIGLGKEMFKKQINATNEMRIRAIVNETIAMRSSMGLKTPRE